MCFRSTLTRAVSLPTRPGCRNFEPEAGLATAAPDSSRRHGEQRIWPEPSPPCVSHALCLAVLAWSVPPGVRAEDATQTPKQPPGAAPSGQKAPEAGNKGNASNPPAAAEQHHLPPDSTTRQTVTLPGRSLAFTATAGSIRLFDDKGEAQADITTTAYQLEGADPATRPVTFLFNGGPGAASAYLQFGAAGPWRLPITGDAAVSSASPDLMPNAETWLDFTDLVFIDPVGTGYSRFVATGGDVRKKFFSVDGDVESIALTIRRWLEKSGRLRSPKFVVGESYGGIRGPKIVRNLQIQQGVGVRGLILISPVLDFREFTGSSLLQYVASLPTMAAVAREAKGAVTRSDMADVEHYAQGDFLADLIKGLADTEATTRLSDKVAALTGIDPAVSRRLAGRFAVAEFRREFDRKSGKVTGRYDASVSGFDPYPDSSFYHFNDPVGRTVGRAADQRRSRPPHTQTELAAGRLLPVAQQRGREGLGLWWRHQSGAVGFSIAGDSRARPQAETIDRARAVRSRHAVFRLANPARSASGVCFATAGETRGLSRRAHVLFARRLAAGLPRRGRGDDEVKVQTAPSFRDALMREPGIDTHHGVWIPGSRQEARPGMTALGSKDSETDQ